MKLADLSVQFISLVKRPANGRGVVLKCAAGAHAVRLVKADGKLHRLYGIVYAPDAVDTQGDWTDAETIRKAADLWMQEGRARYVDREHEFEPVAAFVAESWLIRAGDPLFPDERPGAWAVGIQIEDADLWDAIEAGEVEGLSLAGTARMEKRSLFSRLFHPMTKGDPEMTPDEVRAIVREVLDKTVEDAEADAARERLEKSLSEKDARLKALEEEREKLVKAVEALKAEVEAIKARPAGAAEGDAGGQKAPESFV